MFLLFYFDVIFDQPHFLLDTMGFQIPQGQIVRVLLYSTHDFLYIIKRSLVIILLNDYTFSHHFW